MNVRIKRTRAPVLQLDNFNTMKRFADAATSPATSIQLALPSRDDPIAEAILECLELCRQLRVDERGDAVRLRSVDRPVEDEVGIG